MGVRTKGSDGAVGVTGSLRRSKKALRSVGEAMGVMVKIGKVRSDWISTFITLIKILEVLLLYRFGFVRLFWMTGVPWIYFFLAASMLQLYGRGRAYTTSDSSSCFDILAGKLPTPLVVGEERKIPFDVPLNARTSHLWQATWVGGAIICATSLIVTYVLVAKEDSVSFLVWLCFQIFWLVLRSIFFHFWQETDNTNHVVTPSPTNDRRPIQLNFRLFALSVALSKYQVLDYPRGAYSYGEDVQDPAKIQDLLIQTDRRFCDVLKIPGPVVIGNTVEVEITAVIGDTLLSSVSWIMGATMTGMDLYDSCILAINTTSGPILVPAARVLAGNIPGESQGNPESTLSSYFLPKGSSNTGTGLSWVYWIPCQNHSWFTFSTPWTTALGQNMPVVGKRKGTIVTASDITSALSSGELLVSLTSVAAVKDVVRRSRIAANLLIEMLTTTG
ncbi:hypothetical protein LOZ52_001229 [Ophidiomyces ophidiicola]|uniref:uncharacterized protein n=1 Tax=Ophidiomyces ophidiicola TaxID=1387563 RepID=UPI0020C44963|nr:uncharacterized protein LOZ57_000222 [Ophidiomyces ophidiicola]KAI1923074.1 hypothetical protein LOZ64_001162 [Ophidiomyces ophidiicola]KAI1953881.1 hypothetical protein LOZ57_000222 [Ophidiomyces ophidiicola]KAI2006446.1 hypothetical protein LOZ49_005019 [Ophidiomyces ophidiicola]KAI2008122.1 hypothetical protein LOZ50_002119 [Ophidiomyces ophidiicola]KAI2025798.1 hypothetical protein LOZ46_000733 [Ophidiomyces ophidiicola]